jgi:hypothetical protein
VTDPTLDPGGCELCSYAPDGCSFCSGRSAIEVANERTDVAGIPVLDLTQHLQHLQQVAGPVCGFDDCGHPLSWHPSVQQGDAPVVVRHPCTVAGCTCVDFAQHGSVYHPPGAVSFPPGDSDRN